MKKLRKVMMLVLALAMVLAMGTFSAFATDGGNDGGSSSSPTPATGTITITSPEKTNADETITYKIYKVFSATVNSTTGAVTYRTLDETQNTPDGFTADSNGYIIEAPESLQDTTTAFKNFAGKELVDTVTITGPSTDGTSKQLEPGYYYVETTSGAAVMVTPGGDIEIDDKNELSNLVKSAGTEYDADAKKAIAAVGTDQPFTVVVTKKHGATKLDVSDTMVGMTFNGDVTVDGVAASNYTVTGEEGDATFSISFKSDFVKGLADDTELTIHYSGKVTSDALQTDPGKNTATLTTDNDHTVTDEVEVYNAKITVQKTDGSSKPLTGAGFTLYKGSVAKGNEVSDEIVGGPTFEWKGLGAGTYILVETTVPEGYNKADDVTFTVEDGNYDAGNLIQDATVVNQSGAELPSTGGIGTIIFYVIGSILVIGAGIMLVARRRMNSN